MATADGMEGVSQTQTLNQDGTGGVKRSFPAEVSAQAMKSMSTPELWAGAVAGFVAGTAVGFVGQKLLKAAGKYIKGR